jgi:TRAP-type C4-dicarboxylate transport system permease large subunit
MLLAILIYEHVKFRGNDHTLKGEIDHKGIEHCVRIATNETTIEIGALLLVTGCSLGVGGVIERSNVMGLFPHTFGSVWTAMIFLVIVLIILGMIMDAISAIILVSATIATIAYQSGINPIHFWMTVLVAFELGYLSPPVALNHLLARQVVGEKELEASIADVANGTFYERHERIIMPLIVMGMALFIVAFVPLMMPGYGAK